MGHSLNEVFGKGPDSSTVDRQATAQPHEPKEAAQEKPAIVADAPKTVDDGGAREEQPKGKSEPAPAEKSNDGSDRQRDDKGRFVPLEALHDERGKRKKEQERSRQLETELAQLRGKLEAVERYAPPPKKEPEESDDFDYGNPAGYVNRKMGAIKDEVSSGVRMQIWELSREVMRSSHQDYDEAEQSFSEAVEKAPHLLAEFQSSKNPARFAYEAGKAYARAGKYSSFDDYEEDIRKDEREKILAESRKSQALEAAGQVPRTIAAASGSGAEGKVAWQGGTPLNKVFTFGSRR